MRACVSFHVQGKGKGACAFCHPTLLITLERKYLFSRKYTKTLLLFRGPLYSAIRRFANPDSCKAQTHDPLRLPDNHLDYVWLLHELQLKLLFSNTVVIVHLGFCQDILESVSLDPCFHCQGGLRIKCCQLGFVQTRKVWGTTKDPLSL